MSQQDALLVALNALQVIDEDHPYPIAKHAIEQINKSLAQPEQEPVAWVRDLTSPSTHCVTSLKYLSIADTDAGVKYIPVYIAPPSKPENPLDIADRAYFAGKQDGIEETIALTRSKNK